VSNGNGHEESRMDRFERGVEHLLEAQACQQTAIDKILESQGKRDVLMGQALETINSLARIAQLREKRIENLER